MKISFLKIFYELTFNHELTVKFLDQNENFTIFVFGNVRKFKILNM